jgi:hypothetical protein
LSWIKLYLFPIRDLLGGAAKMPVELSLANFSRINGSLGIGAIEP